MGLLITRLFQKTCKVGKIPQMRIRNISQNRKQKTCKLGKPNTRPSYLKKNGVNVFIELASQAGTIFWPGAARNFARI